MCRLRTTAIILAVAAFAVAVAFASLVASSQPEPVEDVELIAVGNVTMTQAEGEVISIGESSIIVRMDDGDVEIECPTDNSQWLKGRAAVGDLVWVSYHAAGNGANSLGDLRVLAEK